MSARMSTRERLRRGFTLIELLVVIAIIAILAAILFPVFAQAREKARMAACQSNLKQMGNAFMMYTQDYDELWPNGNPGTWGDCTTLPNRMGWAGWVGNILMPYTKNTGIYVCPSQPTRLAVNRDAGGAVCGPYAFTSYDFNYNRLQGIANSNINEVSRQIVMWDAPNAWADCGYATGCGIWAQRDICIYNAKMGRLRPGQVCNPPTGNSASWHNDGQDYLFVDGHVKWHKWEQITWGQIANLGPAHAAYNIPAVEAPPAGSGNGIN
jgi:prepilin-type N-terminal cleavage/methylation domain-containing protein/prepilin-type processing-associated H-X9-DG protein